MSSHHTPSNSPKALPPSLSLSLAMYPPSLSQKFVSHAYTSYAVTATKSRRDYNRSDETAVCDSLQRPRRHLLHWGNTYVFLELRLTSAVKIAISEHGKVKCKPCSYSVVLRCIWHNICSWSIKVLVCSLGSTNYCYWIKPPDICSVQNRLLSVRMLTYNNMKTSMFVSYIRTCMYIRTYVTFLFVLYALLNILVII